MNKGLKIIFTAILILLSGVVTFYFWGSAKAFSVPDEEVLAFTNESTLGNKESFKVMTYNIGYLSGMKNNLPVEMPLELFQTNLTKCQSILKTLDLDIIGFQEIDFGGARSHYQNQLDSLSNGFHMALKSVNWNKNYVPFPYWPVKYHFGEMLSGQAIMTKSKISNTQTITLEKPINAPFYYNAFYLDRLVQVADVELGDQTVKVMNLHLEAFDQETRLSQIEKVKELYKGFSKNMPVLLIGDFNSELAKSGEKTAISELLKLDNIASAITGETYQQNPQACFTFSSGKPEVMIDYILYNPSHIKAISAKVVQAAGEISDHMPVVMEFELK